MTVWIIQDDLVGCLRTFGTQREAEEHRQYLDSEGYPSEQPTAYTLTGSKTSIIDLANYVAQAE